jgi:hypothetical protein
MIEVVVAPPGFQTYVSPPLAVNVVWPPLQISIFSWEMAATGLGFTVTFTVDVDGQVPSAFVAVKV